MSSAFDIEHYINSLPEDIETINISNISLTYIPSLKRFHKLTQLDCSNNQLTSLPQLNDSLRILNCFNNQLTNLPELNPSLIRLLCVNNQLTSLPELNHSLQILDCSENQLTRLPELNDSLQHLFCFNNQLTSLPELGSLRQLVCFNNQLTSLPELNDAMEILYCGNNPLPPVMLINNGYIHLTQEDKNLFNNVTNCLHRCKLLFWSLKYRTQLRDWLWIKVRLPKIEKTYHPSKLNELLSTFETMTEDEFDTVISNW